MAAQNLLVQLAAAARQPVKPFSSKSMYTLPALIQQYNRLIHRNSSLLISVQQVPPQLADNLSDLFGGSHDGLKGLRFDIPRSIDLKPTRTLLDFLPLLSEEKGI